MQRGEKRLRGFFMTFAFSAWRLDERRNRASSLAEVLIVLLILVVIAAVFSLASHHLIVRAKQAKTKEDHRALADALQVYLIDYQDVPSTDQGLAPLVATRKYPVLPLDPFSAKHEEYFFMRHPLADDDEDFDAGQGNIQFILAGVGPNGKSDLLEFLYTPEEEEEPNLLNQKKLIIGENSKKRRQLTELDLLNLSYDPTNGTKSRGDIIKIQR